MQSQTQLRVLSAVAEPSDETLTVKIAQRDRTAFAAIYDRYARSVFVFAAHLLGEQDAEEAVQEVFLRLWNKASQFDSAKGNFRHWFMAIARNYIMDELRRRGQKNRIEAADEIDELLANAADPTMDAHDQAWANQRAQAVLAALKILPDEQRRVLILAYFGGFTQSEIAQQLALPLGTVKKRIRLGLQKLRAELAQKNVSLD